MSPFLRRIADAVGEWFKGTTASSKARKRFEIDATEPAAQNAPQRSGKTFDITGENDNGAAAAPPAGRFVLYGATRPKRCPYCGRQDSVTRGSGRGWKCKVCDSEWR